MLTRYAMLLYWDHYLSGAQDAANLDYAGDHVEYDLLRDEGEAYAPLLHQAGVETTAVRYDGFIHTFFWLPGVLDAFQYAVDGMDRE